MDALTFSDEHRDALRSSAKRIVLVGGGRNANNLLGVLNDAGVIVSAILDDRAGAIVHGHTVQPIDTYEGPEWRAIITVADPAARASLILRPPLRRVIWTSYIDHRAAVSPYAEVGEGTFIAPFATCADATIGRHASIMPGVVLGARVTIGDHTDVLPGATVASDTHIGENCIISMGARIEAGLKIGNNCRIAPNTVIREDMPDGTLAVPTASTRYILNHYS